MPTLPTLEKSSQSRAVCTWCSSTRQILVSCSRVISATLATGIALAKVNTSASNSIVNPEPGRAQDTLICRTPCSGQRTRGSRACNNALCWKKSRCRHVMPAVSCTGQASCAQPPAGQGNRAPRSNSRYRSNRVCSASNSVRATRHGPVNPNAAVNKPNSSILRTSCVTITDSHTVNETIFPPSTRHAGPTRPNPLDTARSPRVASCASIDFERRTIAGRKPRQVSG